MVDGVVLLVDASEGPLPQTRFVLRKALEAKLPVILCVNKVDRPDARIEEVVGEASDLLLGLAQDVIEEGVDLDLDSLLDLPVIYCAAKVGYASENQPADGQLPDNDNLEPLFDAIIKNIPAPEYEPGAPLQAHVANIDSSDFLGRLGLVRIYNGTLEKGKTYGLSRVDGSIENFRVSELLRTQGLDRLPVESAGPGDIVAVAGVNDIMIGETIVDPNDPRPLPLIHVDDPAISMTFGTNDSPLAGTEGKDHKLTARMIKDRLDRELIGNVSIKVLPTDRPDALGKCRAAANWHWPCSPSRCAAKASSSPSGARRWSPRPSTASCASQWRTRRSTCRRSTWAPSRSSWPPAKAAWTRCRTTVPAGCVCSSPCRRVASLASAPHCCHPPAAPASRLPSRPAMRHGLARS